MKVFWKITEPDSPELTNESTPLRATAAGGSIIYKGKPCRCSCDKRCKYVIACLHIFYLELLNS